MCRRLVDCRGMPPIILQFNLRLTTGGPLTSVDILEETPLIQSFGICSFGGFSSGLCVHCSDSTATALRS